MPYSIDPAGLAERRSHLTNNSVNRVAGDNQAGDVLHLNWTTSQLAESLGEEAWAGIWARLKTCIGDTLQAVAPFVNVERRKLETQHKSFELLAFDLLIDDDHQVVWDCVP